MEDIEQVRFVYHLGYENGMTLQGARQVLKVNKAAAVQTMEVVNRLKSIREELISIKNEIDEALY